MKIKDIKLKNFMKYDEVHCSFDENVTYLVGKNGSGKSSLGIHGVQAIMQGIAEKASSAANPLIGERFRFIGPKGATAPLEMTLIDEKNGNAEIVIRRKITKTGSELSIVGPDNYGALDQSWLNDLFNVFLISPKMFCQLSPKEQANALGIDTSKIDAEIAALKQEHTAINRDIKAFGDMLPVEEVKEVDIKVLAAQKEEIRTILNQQYRANQATNRATREAWEADKAKIDDEVNEFNADLEKTRKTRQKLTELRNHLQGFRECLDFDFDDLVDFSRLRDQIGEWIKEGPRQPKIAADLYPKAPTDLSDQPEGYEPAEGERVYIIERPDDKILLAIDQQIFEAGETNKKALLYTQYAERLKQKEAKEKELADNKAKQAKKQEERAAFIASFKFPFSNLTVGEDGELLLAGKPIKEPYFSTGEILKVVPILLSTSNPDLKYVFLQDFNLMDEDKQTEIADYLTSKGFQLVVELVGKKKITDKNCILLRDNIVVEDYETVAAEQLSI